MLCVTPSRLCREPRLSPSHHCLHPGVLWLNYQLISGSFGFLLILGTIVVVLLLSRLRHDLHPPHTSISTTYTSISTTYTSISTLSHQHLHHTTPTSPPHHTNISTTPTSPPHHTTPASPPHHTNISTPPHLHLHHTTPHHTNISTTPGPFH
ncbi:hypothetical protein Pmani_016593 [Petrolisthes manimaculis]|uniref:Uncharacterized protein n=1 Tax=Petrolisthes manimaculis TaxID=1843537 RepID=A0AAE1U686_9EUCA|nr:hypothetical protein Pmani_016593 [Petrolisthes manimaculis]